MKRLLPVFSIFVLLVGCATGPKFSTMQTTIPPVDGSYARIMFYRDSAFGGAYQPAITINGEPFGKAVPNGVFFKDVGPGAYKISTSMAQGNDVNLDLKARDIVYVRLHYRIGFAVYPVLMDKNEAHRAIQNLAYVQMP